MNNIFTFLMSPIIFEKVFQKFYKFLEKEKFLNDKIVFLNK